MAVWRVSTVLDDGTTHETVVLARTGADAGVLVGNLIRAARAVDVIEGNVGIGAQSTYHLPEDYASTAINFHFA